MVAPEIAVLSNFRIPSTFERSAWWRWAAAVVSPSLAKKHLGGPKFIQEVN